MLKGSDVHTRDNGRDHSIAIARIYEAHFDDVWRWLGAMGVREADREDAAQEVFVVVYRKYGEFEMRSKVSTWLFSIATRVAAGFRRRAHVTRESGGEDMDLVPAAADESPDGAAADSQMRAILEQILSGLDDEKRAAFVLYEIEGLTLQEISDLIGCPLQTTYSRLRASREFVRAAALRFKLQEVPR